jgi:ATP-dependent Lhr-like helicase
VRALLAARRRAAAARRRTVGRTPRGRSALGRHRAEVGSGTGEGRWSLLPAPSDEPGGATGAPGAPGGSELLAEAVAGQLLDRWGMVAWELWARESFRTPWREVLRALRRFEARGLALGGRFVAGLSGEQYALAEAAELLSRVRREPGRNAQMAVAASDPLNVTGTIVPGPRVPGVRRRVVVFRDGQHVASA